MNPTKLCIEKGIMISIRKFVVKPKVYLVDIVKAPLTIGNKIVNIKDRFIMNMINYLY